jgi:polygalacturonase
MLILSSLLLLVAAPIAVPAGIFDVTKYGAVGDGRADDTRAVRAAAAAAAAAGGGTLLFPAAHPATRRQPAEGSMVAGAAAPTGCPGATPKPKPCPSHPGHTFCSSDPAPHQCDAPPPRTCPPCPKLSGVGYSTAPFNISSNMRVEIEKGATVYGSTTVAWPLISVDAIWPGYGYDGAPSYRITHQGLLFTWGTRNISVGGGGTIDCGGARWNNCQMNVSKPPCDGYTRPRCIVFSNATDVVFEDVTVVDSPSWNLDMSSVERLRIRRVNITSAGGENHDGIDLDSCKDVIVEDSYVQSGDDTLVVKSGKDWYGRRYNRPSRDIVWRNITTGGGYGLTIGSETSGGVINVTFEDIVVNEQTAGIHIKSPSPRGGFGIHNVTYRNIHLKSVRQCILIGIGGAVAENKSVLPSLDGVLFENIRCEHASTSSYDMTGVNRTYPIRNVRFVNVTMAVGVAKEANCQAIDCTCDALTSPCPSCCRKPA